MNHRLCNGTGSEVAVAYLIDGAVPSPYRARIKPLTKAGRPVKATAGNFNGIQPAVL